METHLVLKWTDTNGWGMKMDMRMDGWTKLNTDIVSAIDDNVIVIPSDKDYNFLYSH